MGEVAKRCMLLPIPDLRKFFARIGPSYTSSTDGSLSTTNARSGGAFTGTSWRMSGIRGRVAESGQRRAGP